MSQLIPPVRRALLSALILFAAGVAEAETPNLSGSIDKLLSDAFPAKAPGATVLVVQNGTVVHRKGYGQANLELGVPMDPAFVLRLGSITKQFTAVAILQLVEAGKLKLDDDVTTLIPDFPIDGHEVTIAHLLTHTSGLPSYTDEPSWRPTWGQDLSIKEILAFTKGHSLKFAPGTDWDYSNTGYVLLGAIIEKTSGLSYADYVQSRIFGPAGMKNSAYGNPGPVMPGRIPGYSPDGPGKWKNATYLSMTHPHAAGALISNVDDLWKWEKALAAGTLVSPKMLEQAYANARLSDGRATGYGYGWGIGTVSGHPSVEHSGGINGFATHALRVPDAGIYIAILCNSDGPTASPGSLAFQIANLVLNEPQPKAVKVSPAVLQDYVGVYRVTGGGKRAITLVDGVLVYQRTGGRKVPLIALSKEEFVLAENGNRFAFAHDTNGKVDRLLLQPRVGLAETSARVAEPFEEPVKPVAMLDEDALERCVGVFQLRTNVIVVVTRAGTDLQVQMTGKAKAILVPESSHRFRIADGSGVFEFKFEGGAPADGLVFNDGSTDLPGQRIR